MGLNAQYRYGIYLFIYWLGHAYYAPSLEFVHPSIHLFAAALLVTAPAADLYIWKLVVHYVFLGVEIPYSRGRAEA